jgi:NitT/TauT family transport system permease protein
LTTTTSASTTASAANEASSSAPSPRGRIWRRRLNAAAFPIGALLLLLAVWEFLVRYLKVPTYIAAAPSAVWAAFIKDPNFILKHTLATAIAAIAGFFLAILVGGVLAVIIAYSRPLERAVYPYLVITKVVPIVAIAPILAIWFGFGVAPKIVVSFLIAFFPIVVNLVLGFRSADHGMLMLMRSMNARESDTFRKIRMPFAMPYFFAALRIAAPTCVVGAIVAEFVGSDSGLGYVILFAKGYLQTDRIFLAVVASALLGILMFGAVVLVESRVLRWHDSHAG